MSRSDEAAVIDLPDGDQLVLYAFSADESDRGTIVRLQHTRRRRWKARPPAGDAPDAFVSMTYAKGDLTADTWQGLCLQIDPVTGAILSSTIIK